MSDHVYTRSRINGRWNIDPTSVRKAAQAAHPGVVFVVRVAGTSVTVSAEPDLVDVSTLNQVIVDQKTAFDPSALARQAKYASIDMRTAELAVSGFTYDLRTFSSSEVAQRNLDMWDRNRDQLTYPFGVATRDNDEVYQVVDAAGMHAMYLASLAALVDRHQAGVALKASVIAAPSAPLIDAVEDPR